MKLLFITIPFFTFLSFGQMLDNTHANAFEGKPEFVPSYIKTHDIQTIRGAFFTKADHDIIRESTDATYYKFNRFGELTFEYKTIYRDTLFTLYIYDERSNIIIKRTADKYGFQSHHYRYDSKNRIISIEIRTEKNYGQDKYLYVPVDSLITSTEIFEYVDLDENSYKKLYLNSAGIIYQEEFFYFDTKNRLIKQETYQKSGYGKSVTEMIYNENNHLVEKKSATSIMGNYTTGYTYEYDEIGNILSMKYYENNTYKTEFQYVYDSDTGMLNALIMRDAETNLMTIIKYNLYTFY